MGVDYLWIALGWFKFGNQYSLPIHVFCDVTTHIQTAWRHDTVACCHNRSSIATAPSPTRSPYSVSLNGMFTKIHQRNDENCGFEKYKSKCISNSPEKSQLNSVLNNMCVIKARTQGCVRNDIEIHWKSAIIFAIWILLFSMKVNFNFLRPFHVEKQCKYFFSCFVFSEKNQHDKGLAIWTYRWLSARLQ